MSQQQQSDSNSYRTVTIKSLSRFLQTLGIAVATSVVIVLIPNGLGVLGRLILLLWHYTSSLQLIEIPQSQYWFFPIVLIPAYFGRFSIKEKLNSLLEAFLKALRIRGQAPSTDDSKILPIPKLTEVAWKSLKILGILFAAVVGVLLLVWLASGIVKAVRGGLASQFFLNNNFFASLGIVIFPMLPVLWPKVLKRQSWKRLADVWLKWPNYSILGVAGFGALGVKGQNLFPGLLKIAISKSQLNIGTLFLISMIVAGLLVLTNLLSRIGRAFSKDEDSKSPLVYFVPSFALAWLGNVGVFTLLANASFLTIYAHLVVRQG